jgi:hypothetical protein
VARKVIHPGGSKPEAKPATKTQRVARPGAKIFEVVIYNKRVRAAVEGGEHHPQYDDDWAENRYIEVEAETPEIAKRKLAGRYPKHLGFVIVDVVDTVSKFDEDA